MNALLTSWAIPQIVDWWALVLLHSLWTATFVALVTAGLLYAIDHKRCALRSEIAFIGMIVALFSSIAVASFTTNETTSLADTKADTKTTVVVLEATTSVPPKPSHHASAPVQIATENVTSTAKSRPSSSRFPWSYAVVMLWLLGATGMLFRVGRSYISAKRLVRNADAQVPDWLNSLLAEVADGLGLLRNISIRVGNRVPGAMVYGLFSPVVLLPTSLITGMPYESMRVILAHELAHVGRGDLLLNLLQRLVESLLFYHPAIWWLSRRVDQEREAACDAVAVELIGQRIAVATALVDSAEVSSRPPSAVALAADGGSLQERVARLVNPSLRPSFRVPWGTFVLFAILGLAGLLSLSEGTRLVAKQIAKALSPAEQVEAVEAAIERSQGPGGSKAAGKYYEVSGRLVAPEGKELSKWPGITIKSPNTTSVMTINQDGTFHTQIKSNTQFFIIPQVEGYANKRYGPFQMKDEPLDLGELLLNVGFQAKILVKNEQGTPLAGVEVESITKWDAQHTTGHGIRSKKKLISNAVGVIELSHLFEGPFEIALLQPDYAQAKRDIAFHPGATVEWVLKRSAPLVGNFVNEAGEGVVGVKLYYAHRGNSTYDPRSQFLKYLSGQRQTDSPIAVSDADGAFHVKSLNSGSKYWLMALHPDFRPQLLEEVTAGQTLKPISLSKPMMIRGRIQGDLAKLEQHSKQRRLHYRNPIQIAGSGYDTGFYAQVDEEGKFEITQLLPGTVRLHAAGLKMTIRLTTESIDDLIFDLERPTEYLSQDSTRKFRVLLEPTAGQPIRGEVQLSWRLSEAPQYGDQQGYKNILVDNLESVEWQAPVGANIWLSGNKLVGSYIKSTHFGLLSAGEGTHEFIASLAPAGLFSGQVVEQDGSPIVAGKVKVNRTTNKFFHFGPNAKVNSLQGDFAIGPLPLGNEHWYRAFVQVTDTWRVATSQPFQVNAIEPVYSQTIKISPPVYLSGRVFNAAGEPAVGTSLQMSWSYTDPKLGSHISPGIGAWQKTDNQGRFRVAISSASVEGEYKMTIRPHQKSTGQTLSFSADRFTQDHDFGDLRMKPSATVRGLIVGPNGKPRSGVTVYFIPIDFTNANFQDSRTAMSNQDGEFEIDGLERVSQTINTAGGKLLKVSSPARRNQDKLGNKRWEIEPQAADTSITIVVE